MGMFRPLCVMYSSCCPSKASVLTVGKHEWFDLNCRSALMHLLYSPVVYTHRNSSV